MLAEIHEQPDSVLKTTLGVNVALKTNRFDPRKAVKAVLPRTRRIVIAASGTSRHAGLAGKFMLESLTRLPVEVDYASEYQHSPAHIGADTLVVVITQSGETADTLAALRRAKAAGATVIAISNVGDSTSMREADARIETQAGPEIAIPSTKTFTAQLAAFYLFSLWVARRTGVISRDRADSKVSDLLLLPGKLEAALALDTQCSEIAQRYFAFDDFIFAGCGIHYPIAMDGALKLKEVAYVHAEGYPLGEVRHGPLALVDDDEAVVLLATCDRCDPESVSRYGKILSEAREIKRRGGKIIAVVNGEDAVIASLADDLLRIPQASDLLLPILEIVPLQLLAYHIAVLRGNDVDRPRHLVKSVTSQASSGRA